MTFVNIAAYKFVELTEDQLTTLKEHLQHKGAELKLKGTILLGLEGINLILAGSKQHIKEFKTFLCGMTEFVDITFKESLSDHQPFTKMLVRIKKEIVTMGVPDINLKYDCAPYLSPEQLKQWYAEGKDMVILDTRNDYEVDLGAFKNAIHLQIQTFRDFPEKIKKLQEKLADKTIVTYCTGGIRCEKAAPFMLKNGFKHVYQLEGGILDYFKKCGGDYYEGECFVFDKRVAVDANLQETDTIICFACGNPIVKDYQNENELCPHCQKNRNGKRFQPQAAT